MTSDASGTASEVGSAAGHEFSRVRVLVGLGFVLLLLLGYWLLETTGAVAFENSPLLARPGSPQEGPGLVRGAPSDAERAGPGGACGPSGASG